MEIGPYVEFTLLEPVGNADAKELHRLIVENKITENN
jgi:hypothetical protein